MSDLVTITGIAGGGDGVGRLPDGRAVFVPRTVPGEQVRLAKAIERHKNFARGRVEEIVTAAPGRVVPACGHYTEDQCGGCQIQHLAYEEQLIAKRAIVGNALRRIGKLDLPDPEIGEATEEWRYGAKVTLAVTGGKGRERAGAVTVGFHPHDRPNAVFPLLDCHIADLRLMTLWRGLRQHLDLLPARTARLVLRIDREGRRHILAESAGEGEPWLEATRVREALAGVDEVVCWWQPTDGLPRIVAGPSGLPATAFEPVNHEMAAVARNWALAGLGPVEGQRVWDLYGGLGDTAWALAAAGASVISVDADEKAVEWARRRTGPGGERIRFIAGKVEDLLPSLEEPPEAVMLAPPRDGLHWDVTLRLTGDPVPRLVYTSCDPATLARDMHRLGTNYRVTGIKAFDLFPQTAQVGTVAVLESA